MSWKPLFYTVCFPLVTIKLSWKLMVLLTETCRTWEVWLRKSGGSPMSVCVCAHACVCMCPANEVRCDAHDRRMLFFIPQKPWYSQKTTHVSMHSHFHAEGKWIFPPLKWADHIESVWLSPQGMAPKKWVRWIWMCFMQNKFNFCGSIFHFLKNVHLLVITVNETLKWTYYCVWGSENVLLTLKKSRVWEIMCLLWGT